MYSNRTENQVQMLLIPNQYSKGLKRPLLVNRSVQTKLRTEQKKKLHRQIEDSKTRDLELDFAFIGFFKHLL